jgi:hypothetical protein
MRLFVHTREQSAQIVDSEAPYARTHKMLVYLLVGLGGQAEKAAKHQDQSAICGS